MILVNNNFLDLQECLTFLNKYLFFGCENLHVHLKKKIFLF